MPCIPWGSLDMADHSFVQRLPDVFTFLLGEVHAFRVRSEVAFDRAIKHHGLEQYEAPKPGTVVPLNHVNRHDPERPEEVR